jgi:hypothetical protein
MYLIIRRCLIAVKEGSYSAFLFLFLAHFWYKDGLSPEIYEGILVLGWVEEDEVQVHADTTK